MARILAISSQTVYGPVGNSASVPALEYLGHTVYAVPTVILSHHPGHGPPAGLRVAGREIGAMLDSLEERGVLDGCHAVFTGYFAADEQIHGVERAILRMQQRVPAPVYLCDPVIGDDPDGLYVPDAVARAIRERLMPLADIVAPNRFELEWLSGHSVNSGASAIEASRTLGRGEALITSVPSSDGMIATLAVTQAGADECRNAVLPEVPHGTGDLLSGLYLGYRLLDLAPGPALEASHKILNRVIAASAGTPVLDLARGLRGA
jgi:pyridoxine kinase